MYGFFSPSRFSEFNDSRHWQLCRLGDLFSWIVAPSLKRWNSIFPQVCVAISIPLLFVARAEECRMSLRDSLRVRLDFFWIWNTILFVSFSCPSLNIDMKIIWSPNFSGSMFRSCKSFWILWRICNDVSPGKIFHLNLIGSPSILGNSS